MGVLALDQPLTIVLPMHNSERQLRSSVLDLLDLSPAMDQPLEIVVVDDGSTDDTYETACELARLYPQVTVLRQSVRQGMSAALDLVRDRLAVEMVVVHDGISAIDASELQSLLNTEDEQDRSMKKTTRPRTTTRETHGSRRFAAVRTLHNRMEVAHRTATCFRWMQLEKPLIPRRRQFDSMPTSNATSSQDAAAQDTRLPVGIPVPLTNLPMGTNPIPQG